MVNINFHYSPDVSIAQMIGYEMASLIWGQLFTDNINVDILATTTNQLGENVIGGATPEFHEQHYGLFLQYFEADITSADDQEAFEALQQGNTVDFLLNGDLVDGNTKLKLTTALAKALGMDEAISLDRYLLDQSDNPLDGTIMMNQNFTWDFDYTREGEAAENSLDFLSVALHETGHILGFTSSLDFTLEQDTLYSGRTELSNFSPLDLFRFSAESLGVENPDGTVNDLSIGGVAWFSTDGGETLAAKMSTGKEGDGYQASHWERRYDPLGIMDPTLWYQERASISDLDLLAFDVMGYDLAEDAGNVENLFTSQSLTALLAQAKVNLAAKLDVTVDWLEANANVAESDLDLLAQLQAPAESTPTESTTTNGFLDGLSSWIQNIYQDWSNNSNSDDENQHSDSQDDNNQGDSSYSQDFYEWWSQNSAGKNSSWQELYEWWAQNSAGKNSSWQELYEWWAQNSAGKNSSWQELYEWWAQDSAGKNSWWQEVFYASADEQNNLVLDQVALPGSNGDSTINYEQVSGGEQDDIIAGDATAEKISGQQGDDLIDGAEGDDVIDGGSGRDTIFGFDGDDSINGGEGDDLISGESGQDVLLGEAGSDVLMGGDHDDYLDGGTGRDFLNGNTGDDVLIGRSDNDALEGEAGKDLVIGGEGQDIGNGGSGDDFIFGDQYSERLKQAFGNSVNKLTTLFTPNVQNPTIQTPTIQQNIFTVQLEQNPIRVEAEEMTLAQGYYIDTSFLQGTIRTGSSNSFSSASTRFTGEDGYYQVLIRYVDEFDGSSSLRVKIADREIDSWILNQNTVNNYNEYKTRTIAEATYLNTNDLVEIQGQAENSEYARVDYIEFVPVAIDSINNTGNSAANLSPVLIEAENMTLSGGYYADHSYYDGKVIRTRSSNRNGVATATFSGETGYYQVVVRYIDESDGNASVSVKIADTEIDSWVLNQNTSGSNQYYTRTISEGMYIDANDLIEIQGQAESSEYARVDYIEFISVEPPTDTSNEPDSSSDSNNPSPIDLSSATESGTNDDILRGGAGNDGIDASEGNDIIFGEDEFNDSSNIAPPLLEGSFNYGQSTYILSQAGTWAEAQAEAQSYGGNLVTINDGGENKWLLDTFGGVSDWLWIGFTDQNQEGQFEWISGQETTYTNWAPGQPYDDGGNQHYAILNWKNQGWDDNQGSWQWQGIIEIDWSSVGGNDTVFGGAGDDQIYGNTGNDLLYGDDTTSIQNLSSKLKGAVYNDSQYLVTNTAMTWEAAQAYAETLGGNLVTLNNAAEEQWIQNTFGTSELFWIGLSDSQIEGTWQWASGEVSDWVKGAANEGIYTNWSPGQPDDYNGFQDYAVMNYTMSGTTDNLWDDHNSDNSYRGIIEIKLTDANDQLTGNGGHDTLYGGIGDDTLEGTDQIVAGEYEKDVLVGDVGADKFILGNQEQAYYATRGYQDYAVIEDFNSTVDTIQFYGSAADYQSQQQGNDLFVSRNGDLVVILENTSNLNLNSSAFEYVNGV